MVVTTEIIPYREELPRVPVLNHRGEPVWPEVRYDASDSLYFAIAPGVKQVCYAETEIAVIERWNESIAAKP